LMQGILPVIAALQQSQAPEAVDVTSVGPLAGDRVPDSAFGEVESSETYIQDYIEPAETVEAVPSPGVPTLAPRMFSSSNLSFPAEWATEAEEATIQPAALAAFEWAA
jgi:hypothetical protein